MKGVACRFIFPAFARLSPSFSLPWRITVVDDGSREEDSRRMHECAHLCGERVRFHRLPDNVGKGGAVYAGWDLDDDSEWVGLAGR